MSRVTITLHIDIPDGLTPDIEYADVPPEPPHVAEFAPLARSYDHDEVVTPQTIREAPAPLCQHGVPMKRYPAGVSKKDGKPYNASWRPDHRDCETKPLWDRDAA